MFLRCFLTLLVSVFLTPWSAYGRDTLLLEEALARVARQHPDLRWLDAQREVLTIERERALQRPPVTLDVTVDNALGSGEFRRLRETELSLSLASVFERGGKLDARRTLAESRIDHTAIERETRRLDLLAETAQRYLAILAQEQQVLLDQETIQTQRTLLHAAQQRWQAGASPQSVVLATEAALTQAQLRLERSQRDARTARRQLGALWGSRDSDFEVDSTIFTLLPDIEDEDSLLQALSDTPEIQRFSSEQRILDARLRLAQSTASADLSWQAGIRHLQGSHDQALLAGISLPLGNARRAAVDVREVERERLASEIEREAVQARLSATVLQARDTYVGAREESRRLQADVLPLLEKAAAATARAYRAGASSHLEWIQAESERLAARQQLLDSTVSAQRALIELQRLIGRSPKPSTGAST